MNKLATLQEFKESGVKDQPCGLDSTIALVEEVNAFIPCELRIRICTFNKGMHDEFIGQNGAFAVITGTSFEVRKQDRKYNVYDMSIHTLKNISRHDIPTIQAKFQEPQRIGVLTRKKLDAWIEYRMQIQKACNALDAENAAKIANFKTSLDGLPVKWYSKKGSDLHESGRIDLNGLTYEFTIKDGYINKKLVLDVYSTDIEVFKQLADNKYIKKG